MRKKKERFLFKFQNIDVMIISAELIGLMFLHQFYTREYAIDITSQFHAGKTCFIVMATKQIKMELLNKSITSITFFL